MAVISRVAKGVLTALAVALAGCIGPASRAGDGSTLTGKVMCGYQGWFNAEGDGANRGYNHWTRGGVRPAPATVKVDLWPDLSELGPCAGADMLYVAMFDEVDEGTAIFKCTNEPPTRDGVKFITYEGLPSDQYLRLTGLAGKVIRGELPATDEASLLAPVQR
jgi:hypothetical protein